MKKTALFLILSLAMIGCEGKKKEKPSENMVQKNQKRDTITMVSTDCENDPLIKFIKTLGYTERADWLNKYGEVICKYDLYKCIEDMHAISPKKFKDMARGHDENRNTTNVVKLYSLSWKELEDFIKENDLSCYNGYIAFDLDGSTAKPRLTSYTNNEAVYSVPLFKGIKKVHKNIDTIYFVNAIVPFDEKIEIVTRERAIFKVKDSTGNFFHYDISDNPAIM